MHQQILTSLTRVFGKDAADSRQVARRLKDLLPAAFMKLRKKHIFDLKSVARAERHTLTDPKYIEHLTRYIDLSASALHAKIQYETHMMLVQARQSIRRNSRF